MKAARAREFLVTCFFGELLLSGLSFSSSRKDQSRLARSQDLIAVIEIISSRLNTRQTAGRHSCFKHSGQSTAFNLAVEAQFSTI